MTLIRVDDMYNDSQHSSYFYSTATLLSLNPYRQEPKLAHLPSEVWNNIKTLKLNRFPITHRRKRGGRRKPWYSASSHQMNNDYMESPISVLTTPRRIPVSRHIHTDLPNGPNEINLKILPKANSNIVSGTNVCLLLLECSLNKK